MENQRIVADTLSGKGESMTSDVVIALSMGFYFIVLFATAEVIDIRTQRKLDKLLKEQQPKTGHWIEHEGFNEDKYYDCSVCDCSLREIHSGMGFCPYCGAKMDNPL